MATVKAPGPSKSSIFKEIFAKRNDLLEVPNITELLELYAAETGKKISHSDRQVAANVKSTLRKKLGMRSRRRRKGKGAASATGTAPLPRATASILALEDAIDDCIYLARRMESERLVDVVRNLRRARNHLIVMNGLK